MGEKENFLAHFSGWKKRLMFISACTAAPYSEFKFLSKGHIFHSKKTDLSEFLQLSLFPLRFFSVLRYKILCYLISNLINKWKFEIFLLITHCAHSREKERWGKKCPLRANQNLVWTWRAFKNVPNLPNLNELVRLCMC